MKTYNELQFVLPAGGVILVDADLMYVCSTQLAIKLVDDAMEYLQDRFILLPLYTSKEELAGVRTAISMLEETRMKLARDYDDARRQYQG